MAQYAGFSLHAGIGVEADQREKLERLARYVSRPPVAPSSVEYHVRGFTNQDLRAKAIESQVLKTVTQTAQQLAEKSRGCYVGCICTASSPKCRTLGAGA